MAEEKKGGDDLDDYVETQKRNVPVRPKGKAPKRGVVDPREEKDGAIMIGIEQVANAAKTGIEWTELQKMWLWDEEKSYSKAVQDALDSRFRYCALMGNEVGVQFLYNKGANIDGVDSDGNTALHLSVTPQEKHLERQRKIMTFLMDSGADCDLINGAGYSAKTHVAGVTSEKMVSIVRVLDVQRKPREENEESKDEPATKDQSIT